MKTVQYLKNTKLLFSAKYLIFGLLCLWLCATGDECSGVGTPPPPTFGLLYRTTSTNCTKFSFKSSEKIFLNSILVTESSSGFSKNINFNYPYPVTNAQEDKVIDEYCGTLPGRTWNFTFFGQSLETGYGFQISQSVINY